MVKSTGVKKKIIAKELEKQRRHKIQKDALLKGKIRQLQNGQAANQKLIKELQEKVKEMEFNKISAKECMTIMQKKITLLPGIRNSW